MMASKTRIIEGMPFSIMPRRKQMVPSHGFSHPVRMAIPEDVQVKGEDNTRIVAWCAGLISVLLDRSLHR